MYMEDVWDIIALYGLIIIIPLICIGVAFLAAELLCYIIAIMDWYDSKKHRGYSGCQMWKFLTK